jgi:3'(2'), 5'-bisphosphate nucleotidase
VILISRSHHNETERNWIEKIKAEHNAEVSIQGSAIKFCRLAEGKASFYPKFGAINEWDVAAGDIILKEAGGSITESDSGREPIYNKESLVQPYFVASTGETSIRYK